MSFGGQASENYRPLVARRTEALDYVKTVYELSR